MDRLRILIADDHEEVRWMMVRILKPESEIVGSMADGRKLIDAATRLCPDVIISDVVMPDLTGPEAMRALRAKGMEIPFVLASVNISAISVERLVREGAMALVDKMDMGYELLPAVRAASTGQVYFSSCVRSWVLRGSEAKENTGHIAHYH